MVRLFYAISLVIFTLVSGLVWFNPSFGWLFAVLVPLFLMGVIDSLQTKQGVRRNFPVIGNLRYFFEFIRPELQQYFVETNHSGRPIPREYRSIVYQRAKGELQSQPFGTQRDVSEPNHEWVAHSMSPKKLNVDDFRVAIGASTNSQIYHASIFNISGMSYGSLSSAAVRALNLGAKKGNFYHNTGEGGLADHHLQGGDLVWQIGTGYFGCRDAEGKFSIEEFKRRSLKPEVKMIEIKLSQGAKPGKGGLLPAKKVTKEIAEIRGVPERKDVVSPAYHTAFKGPQELLTWIEQLRVASDRKPVGIKICVGRPKEFLSLCKAMLERQLWPDFITVDGAEGGTGAAPLEFANSMGMPLEEGLVFVHDALRGFGLKEKITVIAAGKIFTAFHMLRAFALGADIVNSGRGMMLALGCIQALKCNSDQCPVGVATTDPSLIRGLHVPSKAERVARYQGETVKAFVELLGAMGYDHPSQIQRQDVSRRLTDTKVITLEELFPTMPEASLVVQGRLPQHPASWLSQVPVAQADAF